MINLNKEENIIGTTINKNLQIYYKNIYTDLLKVYQSILPDLLFHISSLIDVSYLEAITVVSDDDYVQTLNEIDQGFHLTKEIKPSNNGAAMVRALKRQNHLKCHIVFNSSYWELTNDMKDFNLVTKCAIYHEMAHVEIMEYLNHFKMGICFPQEMYDFKNALSFDTSKACIEEFIACKKSCHIDENDELMNGYKEDLIKQLLHADTEKDTLKNMYNKNLISNDDYIVQSYNIYHQILKLSSYYLGSNKKTIHNEFIECSFYPHLKKTNITLKQIFKKYPYWEQFDPFMQIQSLLENILKEEMGIYWEKDFFWRDVYYIKT